MKLPTSRKQVRQFIGVANYCLNIWTRRSHKLAPLTDISSSKMKFKRTKFEQDSFDEIRQTLDCNNLLTYPDFNEYFKIQTDRFL